MTTPIYVTKPFLPPLAEVTPYLESIWSSRILTNGGPLHVQLEKALGEYLGIEHISLFNNGTVALVTALQVLGISGEVITTPYSFVATANSILWNRLTPVFVDIDEKTLCIDPESVSAAITDRTQAILPVHCYGMPCDVRAISEVAGKHDLRVIYDAAHAFGVRDEGGSVLRYGDLSVLSFHATKVFNTFEGGAIVSPTAEMKLRIDQLKNFGFVDETTVVVAGINGKLNEFGAAIGLAQIPHLDGAIAQRAEVDVRYRRALSGVRGIRMLNEAPGVVRNYSYFPIFVEEDYFESRDQLYQRLRDHGFFARRYFYPLISDFPMYKDYPSAKQSGLSVARRKADQVLCLPIYPGLEPAQQDLIIRLIEARG